MKPFNYTDVLTWTWLRKHGSSLRPTNFPSFSSGTGLRPCERGLVSSYTWRSGPHHQEGRQWSGGTEFVSRHTDCSGQGHVPEQIILINEVVIELDVPIILDISLPSRQSTCTNKLDLHFQVRQCLQGRYVRPEDRDNMPRRKGQ